MTHFFNFFILTVSSFNSQPFDIKHTVLLVTQLNCTHFAIFDFVQGAPWEQVYATQWNLNLYLR